MSLYTVGKYNFKRVVAFNAAVVSGVTVSPKP